MLCAKENLGHKPLLFSSLAISSNITEYFILGSNIKMVISISLSLLIANPCALGGKKKISIFELHQFFKLFYSKDLSGNLKIHKATQLKTYRENYILVSS